MEKTVIFTKEKIKKAIFIAENSFYIVYILLL